MDFTSVDIYSAVTLVDRSGEGGTEFIFDGIRFVLKPGQTELIVPKFVAQWLLRSDNYKVWTTDGEFANRFAVKAPVPQDLVDACGPESADCSPITMRTDLLEGSAVAELNPARLEVHQLRIPASELRERQGTGDRAGFGNR